MKKYLVIIFFSFSLFSNEILIITNSSNTTENLTLGLLESIFNGDMVEWYDGNDIVVYYLSKKNEIRKIFDKNVLGLNEEESNDYWIRQSINGFLNLAQTFDSEKTVIEKVINTEHSLAYVKASSITKDTDVKVLYTIKY